VFIRYVRLIILLCCYLIHISPFLWNFALPHVPTNPHARHFFTATDNERENNDLIRVEATMIAAAPTLYSLTMQPSFIFQLTDRTIKVYNVGETSYELAATLTGAEGPVWQVSWCHPMYGVILAACSFDGSVILYRETRPRDWSILYNAKHLHQSSVNSVCFAPHEWGLMIAAASSDGKVSILSHQPDNSWSVDYINDNPLGVNSVSWAPSGAYSLLADTTSSESTGGDGGVDANAAVAAEAAAAAAAEPPRLVTGGCDNQIRFWIQQSETGEWIEDPSNAVEGGISHSDWVRDVAWAPLILPNVNMVASCSEDGTVIVWSQNEQGEPWTGHLLHTFTGPVWRVSWSETGHILAVSSGDADVALFKKGLDGKWHQMDSLKDEAPETSQQ
jgi:protein transport protein SEC13